jgi:scyllo-inositol 2-dehydrogenase (NADP+)
MIRVGIVGFGLGGRVFHAPLVSSLDGLELAAIVERSKDTAAARYPGVAIYRSLGDLLADTSIALVVITTPSGNHYEAARAALEAGKHVVVDKPMAATATQIADLMAIARQRNRLLVPFHNRRWDSDFATAHRVLSEGNLGRLVSFESYFDRWRPVPRSGSWKEDPAQAGGLLLDIGTHLVDQALVLFGKPEAVNADLARERDGAVTNDAFQVRLRYQGFAVALGSNCLSSPGRPRFQLRGTRGNFTKHGLDPQEAALSLVTRIPPGEFAREPAAQWGTLSIDVDGGMVSRPVAPVTVDYRSFYAGVRDAIADGSPVPVSPLDAWRTARILEWATQSATDRREISCAWGDEPVTP